MKDLKSYLNEASYSDEGHFINMADFKRRKMPHPPYNAEDAKYIIKYVNTVNGLASDLKNLIALGWENTEGATLDEIIELAGDLLGSVSKVAPIANADL